MPFDPDKKYTNHLSVLVDAIGYEAMGNAKAALDIAGYTICKGDPSETWQKLVKAREEADYWRGQYDQLHAHIEKMREMITRTTALSSPDRGSSDLEKSATD